MRAQFYDFVVNGEEKLIRLMSDLFGYANGDSDLYLRTFSIRLDHWRSSNIVFLGSYVFGRNKLSCGTIKKS